MKVSLITLALLASISMLQAQSFNQESTSETGKTSLVGKINKEGLSGENYQSWFNKNYDAYTPKSETIESLKESLSEYTITAFMGTWCGDSKKEVPKFYNILEASNFNMNRLTMVAVDRARSHYKQSPGGEEEGLNIHRVPTFIFYKNGKEVNRIVEHPKNALEDDVLAIVSGNYEASYPIVTAVHSELTSLGVVKFQKRTKKILKQIKPISNTLWELNTYASVLFSANKKEEALAVLRLNTKLFPEEEATYVSLGSKLAQSNKPTEAKISFEKALTINPENEMAQNALQQLEVK